MVKKLIRRCLVCKKYDGRPFPSPAVPGLPVERVSKSLPFSTTGIDLCTYIILTVRHVIARCMSVQCWDHYFLKEIYYLLLVTYLCEPNNAVHRAKYYN